MRTIKETFTAINTSQLSDRIKEYLEKYPAETYGTYFMAKVREYTVNYVTKEYEWVPVDVKIQLRKDTQQFVNPFREFEPYTVEVHRHEEPMTHRDWASFSFGVPNELYFDDSYFSQTY